MAVDLHNRDSLLLSSQSQQYFNDENINILSQKSHSSNKPINQTWSSSSSSGFSSTDFGSALSSPVESELGSTESESDQDDDYIAELTRQMAHYMLQDDENRHEKEAWILASSHQSTQEEVPIRGKFENLKINEEKLLYKNGERFLVTSLEPNSVPLSMRKPRSSNLDFQSKQALIDYQIRAIQFYKLKQEQIMKQKQDSLYRGKQANRYNNHIELNKQQIKQIHQSKGRACGGYSNGQKIPWANLQQKQRTGSEMTAVFLGESGSRTGSCGTGVFLPRGIGKTCESRKKHGCSTVLIPARVVQALKLHFDKMGIESRSNITTFPVQQDCLMGDLRNGLQDQKKIQSRTVPSMNHQETSLPQEWTY